MPLGEKEIAALLKNREDHKILTAKHRSILELGKTYAKNIGDAKEKLTQLIDERDQLIVEAVTEEIAYSDIATNFGVSRQRAQQVARSIDLVRRVYEKNGLASSS